MIKYHDQMGHFSLEKTVTRIQNHLWFRNMRRYVRKHIRGCFECLLAKAPGGRKPGKLHPPRMPSRPMIKLHVDHLGPFPRSNSGNMHILVVVDAFSRYLKLYAVKSTTSAETVKKMDNFINQFGAPEEIVSDRGAAFMGSDFQQFCTKYNVRHQPIASRYPQANGLAESKMKNIIPVIVTSVNFKEEKWDRNLVAVERKLNTTFNKTIATTPFECLYGYQPTFEDAKMVQIARREPTTTATESIRERAKEKAEEAQRKNKEYFDRKRFDGVHYEVGEIVSVRSAPTATGQPTKTQLKYKGPYVVLQNVATDIYKVEKLTGQSLPGTRVMTTHVVHMKLYKYHDEDEGVECDDDEESEREDNEENHTEDSGKNEPEGTEESQNTEDVPEDSDSDESLISEEDEEWKPPELPPEEETGDGGEKDNRRPIRQTQKPARYRDYV